MVTDRYGRQFKKLRVSLLDACNFACTYCVPEDDVSAARYDRPMGQKALSFEQLQAIIRTLHAQLRFKEVHLTGGEPLLYPRIVGMVDYLRSLGIEKIKLTTNGSYLKQRARQLYEAGISGVNVSLDAVDPDVFRQINKRNYLHRVLEGIDEACSLELNLKLNTVVMRSVNDSQVLPLLEYAKSRKISLRYIELMNMGHLYGKAGKYFVSAGEILETIGQQYKLTKLARKPSDTAHYWEICGGYEFGIIGNVSFPFCNDCDRLRLDNDGKIYGCVSAHQGIDITHVDKPCEGIDKLKEAISQKQEVKFAGSNISMCKLGG